MRAFACVLILSTLMGVAMAGPLGNALDRWCNPAFPFFQQKNSYQQLALGNWSQSISYLLPLNPANPGEFYYVGSTQYYQINYYDRPECRYVSVQAWPSCPNPLSPSSFPSGIYFQSVSQDILVDRANPSCFQQYDVHYLTPAVPVVPSQNTNHWTSVSMGPTSLANIVQQVDANGEVTDEVVYAETIMVTKTDTPKQRRYVPATLSGTEITAIAPFISVEAPVIPAPYDTMIKKYMNGQVPLSYMRSCDGGVSWAISNCRQCGTSRTACTPCDGGIEPQCVSTYYLPFTTINPCEAA